MRFTWHIQVHASHPVVGTLFWYFWISFRVHFIPPPPPSHIHSDVLPFISNSFYIYFTYLLVSSSSFSTSYKGIFFHSSSRKRYREICLAIIFLSNGKTNEWKFIQNNQNVTKVWIVDGNCVWGNSVWLCQCCCAVAQCQLPSTDAQMEAGAELVAQTNSSVPRVSQIQLKFTWKAIYREIIPASLPRRSHSIQNTPGKRTKPRPKQQNSIYRQTPHELSSSIYYNFSFVFLIHYGNDFIFFNLRHACINCDYYRLLFLVFFPVVISVRLVLFFRFEEINKKFYLK